MIDFDIETKFSRRSLVVTLVDIQLVLARAGRSNPQSGPVRLIAIR